MQERLYRALYSKVIKMSDDEIDFSMNAKLDEFKEEKHTWLNCALSCMEICFYLPLALVSAIVVLLAFKQ